MTNSSGKVGLVRLKTCCLCKGKIQPSGPKGTWLFGNNAMPLKKGSCCDSCNETKVIPARLARYAEGHKKEGEA